MGPAKPSSGGPLPSKALVKLTAPALLLVLTYGFVVVRPLSRQAAEHQKTRAALDKAVGELEQRGRRLQDELNRSANADAPEANGPKSSVQGQPVAHHSDSPTQLSSRLLDYVNQNQLECLQVTSFDAPTTELPQSDLRLELVGPFGRFKAMLTQVAGELEGVVVSGLTMSRQETGNCRWQVDVQFGGGML